MESSHHQAVLGSGLPVVPTLDQLGGGEREAERPEGHDDERHDPRLFTHHGCQAQSGHFPQRAGVRLGTARERGNISVTDGDSNLILHPRTRNVKYSEVIRISAKT